MENINDDNHLILKEILAEKEISQIPKKIREKIEQHFEQKYAEFLTGKALENRFDNIREEYEEKINELTSKIQDYDAKLEHSQQNVDELRKQLDASRVDVNKLIESTKKYENEVQDCRRDKNQAIDERDSLQKMIDRRNIEIERLQIDNNTLESQLKNAIQSKNEAICKIHEIEAKEMSLDSKEQRMDQERTLLTSQIQILTNDLNRNIGELQNIRSDNRIRNLELDTKLKEKTEELKIANNQVAHLNETLGLLSSRIEEYASKLNQQNIESNKMMEHYKKELVAKTKLADLYKEASEDKVSETNELTSAITDLKRLLTEATDQYGELETKMKSIEIKHEEELEEKINQIKALQEELKNANEFLEVTKNENLEHAIASLAPSAAATSRLIKTDMSLTELYTNFMKAVEESQFQEGENKKLKLQMEKILQELEERAPEIKKQSLDYQKVLEANQELTKQLENIISEKVEGRVELQETHSKIAHYERENKKLRLAQNDLGRQLCYLLKEIEEARGGFVTDNPAHGSNPSDLPPSELISKRLVTFSSISELQENNSKLLLIVRDLSSKLEEVEEVQTNIDQASFEAKINIYTKRINEMEQYINKQNDMLNMYMRKCELFKNLYQERKNIKNSKQAEGSIHSDQMEIIDEETPLASNSSIVSTNEQIAVKDRHIQELEEKIDDLKAEIKTIKEQHDDYIKEKKANDKLMDEEYNTMRAELRELTSSNCKLLSQVEYNAEQLKMQKNNTGIYKSQISSLEERNKNYESCIIKHEQTIMYLKDETLNCQKKLSIAEVQLQNLQQEYRIVKDSEARLKLERESLYRDRHTQNLLMNNIEMIKATFERSENEGKARVESRLDEANRECFALRRRLQEEQDNFRELSADLKRQSDSAKQKMEDEKTIADKLRAEVTNIRELLEIKMNEIKELSKKLEESLTPTKNDNPIVEANKKCRELELKYETIKLENSELNKQISTLRTQIDQYRDIAQKSDNELRILQESFEEKKKVTDEELNKLRLIEAQQKSRIQELESDIQIKITDISLNTDNSSHELKKIQTELKESLQKLSSNNRELRDVREQCNSVSTQLEQVELKYANEMKLHSHDIQEMTKLKEEYKLVQDIEDKLKGERDNAIAAMEEFKNNYSRIQEEYAKDKKELEERLINIDAQNQSLHDQIQMLCNKHAMQQSQSVSMNESDSAMGDNSLINRSATDDDKGDNSDQLFKIIKYLRKEKDIAFTKVDILKTENIRLKSEYNNLERRIEELQLLEPERTKSELSIVTASKHEEALRKVETLNAITDSNRVLREERDYLSQRVKELTERVTAVEDELIPLQEKNRELDTKLENYTSENSSLRSEVIRWRQRANALIEKSNRNPEEFKRIQLERESLAKMLSAEKENIRQINEELQMVRNENSKLQIDIQNVNRQIISITEEKKKLTEEFTLLKQQNIKITNECLELKSQLLTKEEMAKKASDELNNKEAMLLDSRNKEMQIRKIAKKYKDSFFELKTKTESMEGGGESSNTDKQEHDKKINELNVQITTIEEENERLRRENEELVKTSAESSKSKQLLRDAKSRIMSLTESRNTLEHDLLTSRTQVQTMQQNQQQDQARITALEKELTENEQIKEQIARLSRENETLSMRINHLNRQLGMQQAAKPSTSSGSGSDLKSVTESPRTANVKPMAGTSSGQQSATVNPWRAGETPLASIRPMSVQNSRTAAVLPTSQATGSGQTTGSVTALVPPQQQVHTTGGNSILSGEAMSSSPTSSHTDYMPATSSAAIIVAAVPPMASSNAEAESAESAPQQNSEIGSGGPSNTAVAQTQQQQQQQQQAIALVSPRIEQNIIPPQAQIPTQAQQPPQAQDNPQPSTSGGVGASGVATNSSANHQASSSNTVTTTQAGASGSVGGAKRPHSEVEGESSTTEETPEKSVQQTKRTRVTGIAAATGPNVSESGIDVEYQVPTSSQRDQEDDVIIVDSEEEDNEDEDDDEMAGEMADEPAESYEMEEGYEQEPDIDENEGPDIDNDNVPSDNNEAEVDEMPNQSSIQNIVPADAPDSEPLQEQQQSQTISQSNAASGSNEVAGSSSIPWRQNQTLSRQQQATLLMLQQGFEETGDDSIVPSTPTLYVPRHSEAVSSPHPQVPTGRFNFADGSTSAAAATSDETGESSRQISNVVTIPSTQEPSPSKEVAVTAEQQEEPIAGPSGTNNAAEKLPEDPVILVENDDDENIEDASQSEVQDQDGEQIPLEESEIEEGEGLDGVSSEGEKATTGSEELEEGREAEAVSPTVINTRSRAVRGSPGNIRGKQMRMGNNRNPRPAPIVWQDNQGGPSNQQSPSNTPQQRGGSFPIQSPNQNQNQRGNAIRARRMRRPNYGGLRY